MCGRHAGDVGRVVAVPVAADGTFPDEDGRQTHLDGEIAEQLMANADDLLVDDPQIEEVDVLAAKHSG